MAKRKGIYNIPKDVMKNWDYCSNISWEAYHKGNIVYLGDRSSKSKVWIKERKDNLQDYGNIPSCVK